MATYMKVLTDNITLIVIFVLGMSTVQALAEEDPQQEESSRVESPPKLPLWEAGIFGLGYSQPAYPGADERTSLALPLPFLLYRGQYLRTDRGTIGIRAINKPRFEVDVGFGASLGSQSSDIEARKGMDDLGTMIEFGPRLKINLGDISSGRSESRLQFPLRKVIDISHGFVSRGIAFEPQWVNDHRLPRRWKLSTVLAAIFGDKKLNDTFYGVTPAEATPTRPSYTAKSGLIALRASLLASHFMSKDTRLFFLLRMDSLYGAANRDSPLVRRNSGWSAGIGIAWTLGRSVQNAVD